MSTPWCASPMECVCPVDGLTRSAYAGKEVRRKEVCVELATLTAKGQVTVPKVVREALGLKRGDVLSWELDDQSVRLRVVSPVDVDYLRGVEASLSEWASDADEAAFAGL